MTRSSLASVALGLLAALALQTLPAAAVRAQDGGNVTIEQLQEALARRDAIIVDLLSRVRALEQAAGSDAGAQAGVAAAETPSSPAAAAADENGDRETGGDFDIDALAAERALERGLIREGARLLAPGQLEVEPGFAVTLRRQAFPAALTGETAAVGEIARTYEVRERRANLRLGLPWDSQLEIGLPHVTVDRTIETAIDDTVREKAEASGAGAGDATLGFSKVLAVENGARPNLIGRLVWLSGSGDARDGAVALGGGYSGFAGRLSAYWRRDPVVLLVSGGYARYDDDDGLRPGDSLDLSLGLGLAVSPETALIFSLNQRLSDAFERDGIELLGTDRLSSTLDLAVSTTLGPRLLLRTYATAGLTDESPDYGVGLSLSARFDLR